MVRGKALLAKHDYGRALLEFRNASKAMPQDAEPYFYAGVTFGALRDWQSAALSYRKAIEFDPNHRNAKIRLAELFATLGDEQLTKEAEASITELMQTGLDGPEMLETLAVAQLKLGRPEDAIRSLEQDVAKDPGRRDANLLLAEVRLSQGDQKGAEEVLRRADAAVPGVSEVQLALSRIYAAQGRLSEAEALIRRSMESNPSPMIIRELAVLQNSMGQKKEAEENFKLLSSANSDAYNSLYGFFLLAEGRRDEAIRDFERLQRKQPGSRSARHRLVLAYEAAGRTADARRLLDEALKKTSSDSDALLQRAKLLMSTGDYDAAQADLSRILKTQPDAPEAHYWMAKLRQTRGQSREYRQGLYRTLEMEPSLLAVRIELAGDLIRDSQIKEALSVLEQTPKYQKGSTALLAQFNWALWAQGDLQEMRKRIDQALAKDRSPELLIQDGLWKLRAGKAAEARAALEEALKVNPGDLRGLAALKDSYLAQKQANVAVVKVAGYAAQQPNSAPVQEFLGFVLWGSGDRAGARKAFNAAKIADPRRHDADLALVQLDVVERNWDAAIANLNALLASTPNHATARLWLGTLQTVKGDNSAALESFRKAVEASPDSAQALNNFAYALTEQANQPEEALKYAEKAVERAPDNADYADTLGWILYRKGLYSQAVQKLERAASTTNNAVIKYHLSMAYAKAGDAKRGRLALEAGRKIDPNRPEARAAAEALGGAQ